MIDIPGDRATEHSNAELLKLVEQLTDLLREENCDEFDRIVAANVEYAHELSTVLPAIRLLHDIEHRSTSSSDAGQHGPGEASLPENSLLGDYRLIREIGRGGMGVVYEAEQISLGRLVALKVLPYAALLDQRQLKRFRNESRSAAMLKHANIVSVYSIGCEGGVHFYVMELIEGSSLAEVIRNLDHADATPQTESPRHSNTRSSPRSDVDTTPIAALSTQHSSDRRSFYQSVARLGVQAASALQHAHQEGVVHRDIKPSNLLLDRDGKLYVADFGLARISSDDEMTMSGDLLGTLRYMSPEQFDREQIVDHRTDVYSLGLSLYELVAAQAAFALPSREATIRDIIDGKLPKLSRMDGQIPRDLETVIEKATERAAEDRYGSAQLFQADLQRFLDNLPVSVRPPTPVERLRRWAVRQPGLAALCGIVLALLVLIASMATRFGFQQRRLAMQQSALVESLERQDYAKSIRSAHFAVDNAEYETARQALDHIRSTHPPAKTRSFEYRYLRAIVDQVQSIPRHVRWIDRFATCFSPDGRFVASGSFDGEVSLVDAASQQTVWTRQQREGLGHVGRVQGVEFINGGEWLVSVGHDNSHGGKLCLWKARTGEPVGQVKFRSVYPFSVTASPQGDQLAVGFAGESDVNPAVRIFAIADSEGKLQLEAVRDLQADVTMVRDLSYSASGQWLAAATDQGEPVVWELESGRTLPMVSFSPSIVQAVDFQPTRRSSVLAVGVNLPKRNVLGAGDVYTVDVDQPAAKRLAQRYEGHINGIAYSPLGDKIAIAGTDKSIWLTDTANNAQPVRLTGHTAEVNDLDFAPDGTVTSASADGSLRLWPARDWQEHDLVLTAPDAGMAIGVCFHPSGDSLFAGFSSGQIFRWRLPDGQLLESRQSAAPLIFGLDISHDAASLAYCGGDWPSSESPGIVSLLDARTLVEKSRLHQQPYGTYYAVCFIPGSDEVAAEIDGDIHIWNGHDGKLARVLPGIQGRCKTIRASRDGRYLAGSTMSGHSGGAVVWDLSSGRIISRPVDVEAGEAGFAIAIAPDNSTFAFSQQGITRICNLQTGETLRELHGHEDDVYGLDYSPDGTRLLSAGKDGNVHLWDVDTAASVLTFQLDVWIQSARFSPDGNSIAVTASEGKGDGVIRIIRIIGS